MAFVSIVMTSSCTDEYISEIQDVQCEDSFPQGIPMVADFQLESDTRSVEPYQWPDGAVLRIWGTPVCGESLSTTGSDYSIYALYSVSEGWSVYRLNPNVTGEIIITNIIYAENWYYSDSWFTADNYDIPAEYAAYYNQETRDNFVSPDCKYENGKFYLSAVLHPAFGRVRFVSEKDMDVEYNHAKYDLYNDADFQMKDTAHNHARLSFHLGNDGKYYSDYIYAAAIPELKINDYVYRYKGEVEMKPGKTGILTLPTTTSSNNTWLCEKYFEIVKYPEITVDLDEESETHRYNLYSNNFFKYTSSIPLDECVSSQIGITATIKYTVNSYNSNSKGYYFCLNSKSSDSDKYYEGDSKWGWSLRYYESENQRTLHACDVPSHDKYILQLFPGSHDSSQDPSKMNVTFHQIKISNF